MAIRAPDGAKKGKIIGEGKCLFSGVEGKGVKYLEKISQKIAKDIEKSWFQSRSQDFCQSLEGFGFREFGLRKNFGLVS